jgi:nitrogen regulatory protein PII
MYMPLPGKNANLAADTILKSAKTGKNSDGKILKTRVDEAIRIRNGERAKRAISRS